MMNAFVLGIAAARRVSCRWISWGRSTHRVLSRPRRLCHQARASRALTPRACSSSAAGTRPSSAESRLAGTFAGALPGPPPGVPGGPPAAAAAPCAPATSSVRADWLEPGCCGACWLDSDCWCSRFIKQYYDAFNPSGETPDEPPAQRRAAGVVALASLPRARVPGLSPGRRAGLAPQRRSVDGLAQGDVAGQLAERQQD